MIFSSFKLEDFHKLIIRIELQQLNYFPYYVQGEAVSCLTSIPVGAGSSTATAHTKATILQHNCKILLEYHQSSSCCSRQKEIFVSVWRQSIGFCFFLLFQIVIFNKIILWGLKPLCRVAHFLGSEQSGEFEDRWLELIRNGFFCLTFLGQKHVVKIMAELCAKNYGV